MTPEHYNMDFSQRVVMTPKDYGWIASPSATVTRMPLERAAAESGHTRPHWSPTRRVRPLHGTAIRVARRFLSSTGFLRMSLARIQREPISEIPSEPRIVQAVQTVAPYSSNWRSMP